MRISLFTTEKIINFTKEISVNIVKINFDDRSRFEIQKEKQAIQVILSVKKYSLRLGNVCTNLKTSLT